MIYLDTAAVVKLAHPEAESPELESWLAEREHVPRFGSVLLEVEVPRALRRAASGALSRVPLLLERIFRIELSPEIRAAAAAFEEPTLRSLDAIHLATALESSAELDTFVTYDKRLFAAAEAAGLPVASPGA